nr:hypothetical protein [Dietzia sp. oral taxon 368]
MGRSAQDIGRGMGKTAREMNALLFEHGYLDGGPGDYGLTDKGKQFGSETYYERGTGGYQSYNRAWTVRTWDESIAEALNADIAASASDAGSSGEPVELIDVEGEFEGQAEMPPHSRSWAPVALGVTALVLVGGAAVATRPRVRRWAEEEAKPRAQRAWRVLTRRGEIEAPTADSDPVSDGVVEPVDTLMSDVPASELE